MFFRSPDLEDYIKELNKKFVLILNKADLIEESLRIKWSEYFFSQHIEHYFFSANFDQALIDSDAAREGEFGEDFEKKSFGHIYSGNELLHMLSTGQHLTIGCVGYPNVGKSSVINVLCKKKKVGVASQPGKTKHLQTLILTPLITLCDCPGLVFPSLLSSRAEMVTCGVLPIDQLKDVLSPVEIICLGVPFRVLEHKYGIELGGRVNARTLLQKISIHRGFFTGSGLPDEIKAGKMVLKDYVNGRLPFNHMPPGLQPEIEEMAEEVKESIDDQFFNVKPQGKISTNTPGDVIYQGEHKLNKQEKRELKFAARRGEDPNEKLKEIISNRNKY